MEVSKKQLNSSNTKSKAQNKGDYALVQRLVIFPYKQTDSKYRWLWTTKSQQHLLHAAVILRISFKMCKYFSLVIYNCFAN